MLLTCCWMYQVSVPTEHFAPEKIYKNVDYTIKNYPTDIKYADMTGVDKISVKESLLDKWKY